ncbi:MAG: DUF1329 domain-containing protein [Betaproteobacteria bacterium]|nr:DUF1329 domain-containing protein [Betaproteobacteria bacterium]
MSTGCNQIEILKGTAVRIVVIAWFALAFLIATRVGAADRNLGELDGDRTPVGALRSGNTEGTIPRWTGGLASPPNGWNRIQGYLDPFADESPLFTITPENAAKYLSKLSPGMMALLERYPDFRMLVYPTHRTANYPNAVTDTARRQAKSVSLRGISVVNLGASTIPFPIPERGIEAIWNHLVRYLGGGSERTYHAFAVRPNGDYSKIGFHERRLYAQNFDQRIENRLFSYIGDFVSPADLVGTFYLVHEPVDPAIEGRRAWVYNSGQRRVRRAPDLAYDNAQDGSDGLAVIDQYDGFNGSPDRYDWKLLGSKELLVSYNSYKTGSKKVRYDKIIQKSTLNPIYVRYELHRVHVVEATLRPGQSHIYSKRVFYLDEDSWSVLLDEAFDSKGQIWRVGIHSLMQCYDAQVPWYRFEIWHDLTNGAYVVTGLDNELQGGWEFGVKGRSVDFEPDALRRLGTK